MSNILTNNINPRSGNLITIGGTNDKVSIAGTLTYDDVTNIDSVGIITAQAGIHVSSGSSIGIGIAEPTCKLQLSGNKMTADRAMIRLSDDQSGNGNFFVSSAGSGSANKLTIGEGDDIFVSITGDEAGGSVTRRGYVGLGTDNPINDLHVNNNTTGVGPIIQLTNDTGDCRLFFGQNSTVGSANAQGQFRYNVASNYMAMYTAGAERLRIDSSGRLGLGFFSPPATFSVHAVSTDSTTGYFKSGVANVYLQFGNNVNDQGYIGYQSTDLTFYTSGAEKMRIDNTGRVLLGTTSTTNESLLFVKGNTVSSAGPGYIGMSRGSTVTGANQSLGHLYFGEGSANTAAIKGITAATWTSGSDRPTYMTFETTPSGSGNPTERMRIDSSGRLLVGTTAGTGEGAGVVQIGEYAVAVSNGGQVVNAGTLEITIGTSNICYWSGFLYVNNIDAGAGINRTQATYSVFADNQNAQSTFTQISSVNGSASRSFTVEYVDNGRIRFTNTSGSTCNVAFGFYGGGINMG